MGKAGKDRKRRRLETDVSIGTTVHDDNDDDHEDDTVTGEDGHSVSEGDVSRVESLLDFIHWECRGKYYAKEAKALRTAFYPLIQLQIKAHFEPPIPPRVRRTQPLEVREIALLKRVASTFAGSEQGRLQFLSPPCRALRRALHPFVLHHVSLIAAPTSSSSSSSSSSSAAASSSFSSSSTNEDDRSFSARISNAFRARDFSLALQLLYEMSLSAELLKLGALQRWVRDCDLANEACIGDGAEGDNKGDKKKNLSLLLLDAVMRVGETNSSAVNGHETLKLPRRASTLFQMPPSVQINCHVETFPLFRPQPPQRREHSESSLGDTTLDARVSLLPRPIFSVVHSLPGADRKPPSQFNLNIYATAPNTIDFSGGGGASRTRHDVPGVPGAFLLTDILSPFECRRIISVAEQIGYSPDAVDDIDNIQWLADESFLGPIFERCRPLLPQTLSGAILKGLNARFRLFRYYPGAVYRPHIDGAWPGSGFHPVTGAYTDDCFTDAADKRYSKLTFLVYLNDIAIASSKQEGDENVSANADAEVDADANVGGATTFFLPSREKGCGNIEARRVSPSEGCVLCFPHGDVRGSLVHEGSEVARGGVKYIIRSDVLYSC